MAVLTDAQRVEVWKEFMEALSRSRTLITLTKSEVRDFLNDTDQWISDNAAAYNLAISQPARGVLTASLKSQGFNLIGAKRFQEGV